MPRARSRLVLEQILKDELAGVPYKVIGQKYGNLGSRGGKALACTASEVGKQIVNSRQYKALKAEILPKGEATRQYVRRKLYEHSENRQNPHVSLKALDLLGKTEAMYTEKVDLQGKYMMGQFLIDLEDVPKMATLSQK